MEGKLSYFQLWEKKKLLFDTVVTPTILYECEVQGCSISRDSRIRLKQIQNNIITYILNVKSNTPYPIFFIQASLSPIKCMTMIIYLVYKNKINNMDDEKLAKIASNSNNNHHHLKRGRYQDVKY